jgi:DNA-binding PadR family transcriptional regulator
VLKDAGIPVSRASVFREIGRRITNEPARGTVYNAFSKLEEYGLVRTVDPGDDYVITDLGEAYLAGDLDASDLDPVADES